MIPSSLRPHLRPDVYSQSNLWADLLFPGIASGASGLAQSRECDGVPGSCVVDSSQVGGPDENLEAQDGKGSPFSGRTEARVLALLLPALCRLLDPWTPKRSLAESAPRPLRDRGVPVGGQQCEAGALHSLSEAASALLCWLPTLSVQTEVGVFFMLNYSARNQRGAAWKHMSFCLGIIDTESGKYLLDHPVLSLPGLVWDHWCFLKPVPWDRAAPHVSSKFCSHFPRLSTCFFHPWIWLCGPCSPAFCQQALIPPAPVWGDPALWQACLCFVLGGSGNDINPLSTVEYNVSEVPMDNSSL